MRRILDKVPLVLIILVDAVTFLVKVTWCTCISLLPSVTSSLSIPILLYACRSAVHSLAMVIISPFLVLLWSYVSDRPVRCARVTRSLCLNLLKRPYAKLMLTTACGSRPSGRL